MGLLLDVLSHILSRRVYRKCRGTSVHAHAGFHSHARSCMVSMVSTVNTVNTLAGSMFRWDNCDEYIWCRKIIIFVPKTRMYENQMGISVNRTMAFGFNPDCLGSKKIAQ